MSSGRRSKLSKEIIKKLVKNLLNYPVRYAAPLSGVCEKTFYNWYDAAIDIDRKLDSGELIEDELTDHQELLLSFLQLTTEARIKLEIPYYDTIRRAAKWKKDQDGKMRNGDIKAAQWMLSKLNPKDWGDIPPQLLMQFLQGSTSEESESGVIEAPSLPSSDDPASAFMQTAATQQKSTTELANSKQKEDKQ